MRQCEQCPEAAKAQHGFARLVCLGHASGLYKQHATSYSATPKIVQCTAPALSGTFGMSMMQPATKHHCARCLRHVWHKQYIMYISGTPCHCNSWCKASLMLLFTDCAHVKSHCKVLTGRCQTRAQCMDAVIACRWWSVSTSFECSQTEAPEP